MAGVQSDPHFFEGTEKLLEVWFESTKGDDSFDLRNIGRLDWEHLLRIVRCEIISKSSSDDMDAYVLSESSMFITQKRFILKTCGRTTLLLAMEPLIRLVTEKCGDHKVVDVFYSRKKFAKPEQQHKIHRTFEDEVHHLDQLFKNGAAYTLGKINKDCWHLYMLEDVPGVKDPDQTIELLMWDMCPEKMKIFTKEVSEDGAEATQKSGIIDIIPGLQIDDFLFDPCGYSMNGILPGGFYITIHITPEPHCSYVSFESNVPQESYYDLVHKVLGCFNPGKFLMTVFSNKISIAKESHKHFEDLYRLKGYKRKDHQFCAFQNYNLTYTMYTRPII
ncbi:S-adenosylmethionine decarboxylase proenzyme-like [Mytilus galloprovincialis]|uniref:S-adenosylmethionine decarboxylase proenzyme-like n=1 Tax=Mytilus edulis TaxID=6550 RepID=UPI0039F0E4AE